MPSVPASAAGRTWRSSSRAAATTSDAAAPGWRLILGDGADGGGPCTGARNMAVDQALLESVRAGAPPALRLYRWSPACLSFGRNQHTRGIYDARRLHAAGIDAVRRPTGGLAVLHDRELTYAVAARFAETGPPRAAYHAINRALVAALQRLGVPATLSQGAPRRTPAVHAAEPCFQAAAAGEVVAAGRKLVGSAQRAERGTLLQHGSLLLAGSQAAVRHMLVEGGAPGGAEGAVTLHELLGRVPEWEELVAAVAGGFGALCGTRLAPGTLTREEAERARQLEGLYAAPDWTWRR